jgi:Rab11 family-interacting protein 3/4
MNRSANKEINSDELFSSSSLPHRVSRVSIGSNTSSGNNGAGHRLTSGKTDINRSYDSTSPHKVANGDSALTLSSPANQLSHQSSQQNYYTLGSQSLATSYNSEEISDTINSSLLDEEGNSNGSLFVKVEQLQRQVEALSESQASQDERYKRTRKENDDLLNRIHLLEDQLRDLEIQSEKQSREDEKRFKETMAKQIKISTQECEQHLQANYQLQQDIIGLQKELIKSESMIRTLRSEKEALEMELSEKNNELVTMDEEIHKLKLLVKHLKDEENVKSNIINILNEELVDNHNRSQNQNTSNSGGQQLNNSSQRSSSSRRSSVTSGFGEDNSPANLNNSKTLKDMDVLEANLVKLREDNRRLRDLNEELQAQLLNVQLEEGRSLIQEGNKSYSLADEMGDIDVHKLMEALKDQQDDNARLRKYIDDILLKIVENNPEILDKTTTSSSEDNKKVGTS